jgi:diguanylate cyclase (GGDEF)-like protein
VIPVRPGVSLPSPTDERSAVEGRFRTLRGSLQAFLSAVIDNTALLRVEVGCPLIADGTVVAERAAGTAQASTEGSALLVRRMRIPMTDRLPESVLLVVATDEASLGQAKSLPFLIAELLDAHLARLTAEETAKGALEMANRDHATGLGNRRAWMQTLRVECARVARTERPLAVLIVDIDGLKAINDDYGHAAGDRHIARTAQALSRLARTTDHVCRLGGDEFGIAAPDTDVMQARMLVDRMRSCLLAEGLQVSIGWAASADEPSRENLWQLADASMYKDKRARRLYGPTTSPASRPDHGELLTES